jgi:hypothetical protein
MGRPQTGERNLDSCATSEERAPFRQRTGRSVVDLSDKMLTVRGMKRRQSQNPNTDMFIPDSSAMHHDSAITMFVRLIPAGVGHGIHGAHGFPFPVSVSSVWSVSTIVVGGAFDIPRHRRKKNSVGRSSSEPCGRTIRRTDAADATARDGRPRRKQERNAKACDQLNCVASRAKANQRRAGSPRPKPKTPRRGATKNGCRRIQGPV